MIYEYYFIKQTLLKAEIAVKRSDWRFPPIRPFQERKREIEILLD